MAASKAKAPAIGSMQWVQSERAQAGEYISQDLEEFSFSVRNEMEWLNEHMADIFTKTQVNFVDVFKTPGKLRGKTPRTARKRDSAQSRQPLTDIFGPNATPAPTSINTLKISDKPQPVDILARVENQPPQHPPISRSNSPLRAGIPYTDSGYHGMTEDEMDKDAPTWSVPSILQHHTTQVVPIRDDQPRPERVKDGKADETGASDDSFVSAKEDPNASKTSIVDSQDDNHEQAQTGNVVPVQEQDMPDLDQVHEDPDVMDVQTDALSASDDLSPNPLQRKSSFAFSALPARERLGAKSSTGNPTSQIEPHPTQRNTLGKSMSGKSVEFEGIEESGLPQEKPAESKAHNKTSTQLLQERISMLGKTRDPRPSKSIPSNALAGIPMYPQLPDVDIEADVPAGDEKESAYESDKAIPDDDDDWILPAKPAEPTNKDMDKPQHNQLLTTASPVRPAMHQKSKSASVILSPVAAAMAPPTMHHKAFSVSHPDLTKTGESTTPTASPPSKKAADGPLSASKNKLWSALKSAKSIFASSASASAAAKLEAHNDSPVASPTRDFSIESHTNAVLNMPGALYSDQELRRSPSRPISIMSVSSSKTAGSTAGDKKREKETKAHQKAASDLEKARETERHKAARQHRERLENKPLPPVQAQTDIQPTERQGLGGSDLTRTDEPPPPPPKSGILTSGKLRAPGRVMQPAARPQASTRPAPISIQIASRSQRLGQSTNGPAALSKSQYEGTAPPPPPKDNTASRPSSSQSNKSGPSAPGNARLKALEAAARKKEADEKAAQRKADQKRELERKRAAKVEEEKRAEEERKAAEQQRVQEAKLNAQRKAEKQAAEARKREQDRLEQQKREQERAEQQRREQEQEQAEQQRREQERVEQQRLEKERAEQQKREHDRAEKQRREQERAEQQRLDIERAEQQRVERQRVEQQKREQERINQFKQQEDARKAREAHELAEAIKRERAQQAPPPRHDIGGTLRQLVKHVVPVQINPAKPAKRQLPAEDDEAGPSLQRPGLQRGPPSFQQTDAKRRRTNEEQEETHERHSVMAPPKRPSNLRKETLNKFPHSYVPAQPAGAHHVGSMFKTTVTAQHQMHHGTKMAPPTHLSQTVQFSNARIPFAEDPSSAGAPQHASNSSQLPHAANPYDPSHPAVVAPNKFKTPARPAPQAGAATKSAKSVKSSPLYQNGDQIALPEIATDSEDEDSDEENKPAGFRAPSWVASPALRELLTQQQLVDPETVFGPIADLKMDEVFRNAKNPERLKKFRDRGSSALWVESGDAVTSAEKRRDMELRERVAREGGWRYEPNPNH